MIEWGMYSVFCDQDIYKFLKEENQLRGASYLVKLGSGDDQTILRLIIGLMTKVLEI